MKRIDCGEPRHDDVRWLVIRETGVTMLLVKGKHEAGALGFKPGFALLAGKVILIGKSAELHDNAIPCPTQKGIGYALDNRLGISLETPCWSSMCRHGFEINCQRKARAHFALLPRRLMASYAWGLVHSLP
ncbi:MAG: hypothetical protein JWR22_4288 [Herminiimonas sp.]|nr:hypothetical protein [Herminiimonas sp.]